MNRQDVAATLALPIAQELLASSIPARLAYTGLDGLPRVIPLGFLLTGEHFVMGTVPASAKVGALRANPEVAITVDTQDQWPPRALLIRGRADLQQVSGVPDAYVEACRKLIPPADFPTWEAGVRALYEEMVLISVEPHWARLLDFETTAPKAVEDLARRQQAAGRSQTG
jgi:hypothetical protein